PGLDGPWSDPPPQQPMTGEVLKSVERPDHSRTFGTRLPPKGLSGAIRRAAFRRSENDIGHWLLLVAADRIDVVEGLCEDARRSPAKTAMVVAGIGALGRVGWGLRRRRWGGRAPTGSARAVREAVAQPARCCFSMTAPTEINTRPPTTSARRPII